MDRKGGAGGGGGLNFTKQMPNFLAAMANGGGAAPDVGGIEGALARDEARRREPSEDRSDGEDEAPTVVDEADALTAKERKKLESKPSGSRVGGSLRFKDEASAAAKFAESAYSHVAAEEQRRAEAAAHAAQAAAEEAEASAGGHVFKAGAAQQSKLKGGGKRKADAASGVPKVKAVKNAKLLSFDEED